MLKFTLLLTLLLMLPAYISCFGTTENTDNTAVVSPTPTTVISTPTVAPSQTSTPIPTPTLTPTPVPNLAPSIKIDLTGVPLIGDKDAPITIMEFSDYQCPFCARFHTQTLPIIKELYLDKGLVNVAFIDFPLNIHDQAINSANAAWCAHDQGQIESYQDKLFESQSELSDSIFSELAEEIVGIDVAQFSECYDSKIHNDLVQQNLEFGISMGIRSTPSFLILKEGKPYSSIIGAQGAGVFKIAIDSILMESEETDI